MIQKNVSYKEVKVIDSNNVDLHYAPDIIKNRTATMESEGWKRFGPLTPIYDVNTGQTMFIQALTRN